MQVWLTLNEDNTTFTADKTFEECVKAYNCGVPIYIAMENDTDAYTGVVDTLLVDENLLVANLTGLDNTANTVSIMCEYSGGEEAWFLYSPFVTYATKEEIPAIPESLKNPNALVINGTSYNGAEPIDFTDIINTMIDTKLSDITNAEEVSF